MGRIGAIQHEDYDPNKLDRIHKIIEIASKTGEQKFYEIFLDNLKVVPKTSDPEKFNSFTEFITKESECLTLHLYFGTSQHSDIHYLYFKGVPPNKIKQHGLSGVSMEEWEKQQKDKFLKEQYYENLEKENEELKAQLEELEEDFTKQEEHWEKIKNGKINSFGEIGSAIVLNLLNNPGIRKRFPGLNALGDLGQVPSTAQETNQEEKATFRRKGQKEEESEKTTENNLSEQEILYLDFLRKLSECLDEKQMETLIHIIAALGKNPIALNSTYKHILNFLNGKPKSGKEAA